MKHKRSSLSRRKNSPLSPFEQEVEAVLKSFGEPALIGVGSPLAAPYLLHEYLKPGPDDPEERGSVLCDLLREAVSDIDQDDPNQPPRYRHILERYYLSSPNRRLGYEAMGAEIGLSPNAFNTARSAAIRSLSAALTRRLKPALRLESPPETPATLFGRDEDLARCKRLLRSNRSIMLTGNSGVGKTTVASYVARHWDGGPVFWHTIRLGFNDQVSSLLYSLSYFLHLCGDSTLWREVVAQAGALDREHALDIARNALLRVTKTTTPLFCFDEVDVLNSEKYQAHGELLQFINGLRPLVWIVIVGQHSALDVPEPLTLEALSPTDASAMLAQAQISLSHEESQRLFDYAKGNPRILELFVALHAGGESFTELLKRLQGAPSLSFLLRRTLQRLNQHERKVMKELAVFRIPAPQDYWNTYAASEALRNLVGRRLVQADGHGGVSLLPAYRETIYKIVCERENQRRALHQKAAEALQARSVIAEAMHHMIQATRVEDAIWYWAENRQLAIDQGQGVTALRALRDLKPDALLLSSAARGKLALECAELEHLMHLSSATLEDLRTMIWEHSIQEVDARILEGTIANDRGQYGDAKAPFEAALALAEHFVEARLARIHKGLSYMHMQTGHLDAAWREAQLALYEAENNMGAILDTQGKYAAAEECYRAALGMAENISHEEGIAKTTTYLTFLNARQGNFAAAKLYQAQAEESYTKIGRVSHIAGSKIDAAFTFNLAGEHGNAVTALRQARALLEGLTETVPATWDGIIEQGMAEAHLGLGDFDVAEQCARRAIALARHVEADASRTLGEVYLARGDLAQAESYIRRSIELITQAGNSDPYLAGFGYRALARVLVARGDDAAAAQAMRTAIQLFEEINLSFEVARTNKLLPGLQSQHPRSH